MSSSNALSKTAQVSLVLGVLLVFSVILTFVGHMAADETRQKMAAFAAEPVVVTGTITQKRIDSVRPTAGGIWVHWLDVKFETEDGATRNQSIQVANSIWERYETGDPVKVTYVRSNPSWSFVPGTEPTARDAGIMEGTNRYGMIASVLFAGGLLGWIVWTRGGDAGGGNPGPAGPIRSASPPMRDMRPQSRTTFGLRGNAKS
jgi:Protein of unknown function (DUF3592)